MPFVVMYLNDMGNVLWAQLKTREHKDVFFLNLWEFLYLPLSIPFSGINRYKWRWVVVYFISKQHLENLKNLWIDKLRDRCCILSNHVNELSAINWLEIKWKKLKGEINCVILTDRQSKLLKLVWGQRSISSSSY